MPGVPSGRGCDGCRKQKKKCDQAKPSCSRCARLNMPCIGAGKQRFKFKEERGVSASAQSGRSTTPASVPDSPTSSLTILANGFINAIKWSTDMRFNLAWSYGIFLQEIPSRLGTNEALDSAVEAVTDAHSTACCLQKPTPSNLVYYSKALRNLKACLDDPMKATSANTLAAVMILLICQSILGISNRRYTGHGEGAARILKIRGRYYNPHDKFESTLLLSLRGPVVFEGCFNPRIQFTRNEWKTLVENHLDASYPEGRMMRCVARAPDFIRRGKALLLGQTTDFTLLPEMQENYKVLKSVLAEFLARLASLEAKQAVGISLSYLDIQMQIYTSHQRLYGVTLVIGIILNRSLSSLDVLNAPSLQAECEEFVKGIISIWKNIANYKPIGSACLGLFLNMAWAGTSDISLRKDIEEIMAELESGFILGNFPKSTHRELAEVEGHLRLLKSASYDGQDDEGRQAE
ncbi:hypothetical protein K505DRAFT_297123 [Melanomma pulvis-pyrius CBS 109.77]|uniref:Zn(2)-C6 fungal-type domain-containing protein n=1 Tax=Melanomma pulvis-pyrius CBS 109.77 TaxID=1314802 RepID=A0A6A6XPU2_9PLEO|nr:hypothetical protein K505DRAFT_297123 [Melanomma pulvis-pyrius CBS 109.77]